MTGLNLSEILPKQYLSRIPGDNGAMSGRSGFVISLNKNVIDGRLDITQIGGTQLIALINVLDPNYEDEKMNRARSLLAVGYPTAVTLAFAEGYMDMGLDLNLLGVSQSQDLRGIPVSALMSSMTEGLVNQAESGPFQ